MSSLEFNINARDQASAALASVQKKVADFGKEVGRSVVAIVGPMAALQFGISKVTEYFDEMARKSKEAFDWGANLTENASKLGVTADEFQRINFAANATGTSVDQVGKAFKLAADLIEQGKKGNKDAVESLAALGISVDDLGKTRPEDVLNKLAGAMAAASSPTEKMSISMAALGKAAKELQDVLSKGLDISGALGAQGDLTNEAARYLMELQKRKKEEELREMAKTARQQATAAFLTEDPEGKAIVQRLVEERMRAQAQGGGVGTTVTSVSALSNQADIQAQVQAILKDRADKAAAEKAARDAAIAQSPAAQSSLTGLRTIVTNRKLDAIEEEVNRVYADFLARSDKPAPKLKEEKQAKVIAEKAAGVTVSTLREMGGGLSGEQATMADVAFQSLGEQKQMNETLRRIEAKLIPSPASTDFTKDPRVGGVENFTPGNFTPGPMTAASRIGVA